MPEALQAAIGQTRDAILSGSMTTKVDLQELLALAENELVRQSLPSLRRVINATGIVLHTGLGRAPLCDVAIEAIAEACSGYCNLEYDLTTGKRGRRVYPPLGEKDVTDAYKAGADLREWAADLVGKAQRLDKLEDQADEMTQALDATGAKIDN